MNNIYDIKVNTIDNKEISLSEFKGKILLIVNTASKCGFTYQYEGLERMYKAHKDNDLVILGFPCNQFNQQEPGNAQEIKEFCTLKYDVSFPLFTKIDVKGQDIHPLYDYLTNQKKGLFGSKDVKWNFTKFLVNKDGEVIKRFAPIIKPEVILKDIIKLL